MRDLMRSISTRIPDELRVEGRYAIIGVGGIGTWIAIALALSCTPRSCTITLIDSDVVEVENMNRLPIPFTFALDRVYKVDAVAWYIQQVRPDVKVFGIPTKINTLDDLVSLRTMQSVNMVIETTDSPMIEKIVKRFAYGMRLPLISAKYDGLRGSIEYISEVITSQPDTWDLEIRTGYSVFPSTPIVPMFIASLVVAIIASSDLYKYLYIDIDLKNLRMEVRKVE